MRLTRDVLIKIARDTAAQRVRVSRRLVCIYLTGSVLDEDPLLGGTTDIDLVIVHDSEPMQEREIVRLSEDVHLDIAHYAQEVFHQPRRLRADPWLGPFIYSKPLLLHDTQHWFEFTQASTGAQFYTPDYISRRANALSSAARQGWMDLQVGDASAHPQRVQRYLQAVEDAGNAIASLSGPPITERRFFLNLAQRVQAIQHPELSTHLMALVVDPAAQIDEHWPAWMAEWKNDLAAAARHENAPARLHPGRVPYYERAAAALWNEHPIAALWILVRTWTLAAAATADHENPPAGWLALMQYLQMDESRFDDRLQSLDSYLDEVDEMLEQWSRQNGVTSLE
jgi:predicted nucleotidyltransferase